jgi:hypothetical protein
MSIRNYNPQVRADGSCLLQFVGPANRSLDWLITAGDGAIDPMSAVTDAYGSAWALYRPNGYVGSVTVEVRHGT